MISADIVVASRDSADSRRRILGLTPAGRGMSVELFDIWKELAEAQRRRFAAAGCDIMTVMQRVEDGLAERDLASEVLARIAADETKKAGKAKPAKKRISTRARSAALTALIIASALTPGSPVSAPIEAQVVTTQRPAIDAAARAALVNALSDSLIASYIYEKTGRMLADSLRAELRSGAYDGLDTGEALAQRVNQTLKRISNDRHLGVQYLQPAVAGGPARRRVAPSDAASTTMEMPSISRVLTFPDAGIASARILTGNIGYLDLRGFSGNSDALPAIDSAMALFAGTKAIIIDLGRNRGGGPLVIQYLSAYFFDKPTHLVSTFMRGMDSPRERWTATTVSGKRVPKTPLYLLTSSMTISAAESFAFGLRNHGRITIVGERTAGGGHFGGFVPLTPGFTVFLPTGRTYNPATSEGWEAEGLKPDVEVPYANALKTAVDLAKKAP